MASAYHLVRDPPIDATSHHHQKESSSVQNNIYHTSIFIFLFYFIEWTVPTAISNLIVPIMRGRNFWLRVEWEKTTLLSLD